MRVSLQITLVWVFFVECSRRYTSDSCGGGESSVCAVVVESISEAVPPHGLKRRMNSAISRLLDLCLLDLRLLDSLEWDVSGVAVRGQLALARHGGKWGLRSVRK
jgi:hypothetical protein